MELYAETVQVLPDDSFAAERETCHLLGKNIVPTYIMLLLLLQRRGWWQSLDQLPSLAQNISGPSQTVWRYLSLRQDGIIGHSVRL